MKFVFVIFRQIKSRRRARLAVEATEEARLLKKRLLKGGYDAAIVVHWNPYDFVYVIYLAYLDLPNFSHLLNLPFRIFNNLIEFDIMWRMLRVT